MKIMLKSFFLSLLFVQFIQAQEYIEFVANPNLDTEFVGVFNSWEYAQFSMPNNDILNLEATLEIDLRDISAFSEQISDALQKEEYFHTEKYPIAKLTINQVSLMNNNQYEAQVSLTLKGITQSFPIQFNLNDSTIVEGNLSLNRLDFEVIGDGPGEEVQIRFSIQLPQN